MNAPTEGDSNTADHIRDEYKRLNGKLHPWMRCWIQSEIFDRSWFDVLKLTDEELMQFLTTREVVKRLTE